MALMRNHLAVVSAWTPPDRSGGAFTGCIPAPLVSGILTPGWFLIQAANEVDKISHIFLGESVVDPRRHRSAQYPVKDGIEQAVVGDLFDKPAVAQVARVRQNIDRVRPLPV